MEAAIFYTTLVTT